MGADVIIIGNTFVCETLKDGYILSEDNPLRKDLFFLELYNIRCLSPRFLFRKIVLLII